MEDLKDKRLQGLAFDSAKLLAAKFPEYLRRYAKTGEKVNPNHYSFDSSSVNADREAIWEDAENGLVMIDNLRGGPITALVGYNFKMNGQPLVVVSQIQSTRNFGVHYSLQPLRWERMLLRMVTDFWFGQGINVAAVQPAESNRWFNHAPIDRDRFMRTPEEFQADLKRRYNGTARREGFRYDAIKNLFLLSNPSLSSQISNRIFKTF